MLVDNFIYNVVLVDVKCCVCKNEYCVMRQLAVRGGKSHKRIWVPTMNLFMVFR